jgi:hypothetical protein
MTLFAVITVVDTFAQRKVFEDDFESGNLTAWNQTPTSPADSLWRVGTGIWQVNATDGSNYAYLYTTIRQSPVKLVVSSVNLATLRGPVVTFLMSMPGFSNGDHDTLKVYCRALEEEWTLVNTFATATQKWTEQSVSLAAFSMRPHVDIAFEYNYGAGKGIAIDRVSIGATAICIPPANLSALRVSHNSATLLWDGNAEASGGFHLKVSTTPLTDLQQTADIFDQTIFYSSRMLTGLSPSTTYYYYVQADCGDGDVSVWSQEKTFTTTCAPLPLPYTELFNSSGVGTGHLSPCWQTIVLAAGNWGTDAPSAEYTPHCAKLDTDTMLRIVSHFYRQTAISPFRYTKTFAVAPALETTNLAGYQLSFNLYSSARTKLHIGVMSDSQDASTFIELTSIVTFGGIMEECVIPLTEAPATHSYIAFMLDASDYEYIEDIYIDNMEVTPFAACFKPSMLQTVDVFDTIATLTWMGFAQEYDLRISTVPINPDTVALPTDAFNSTVTAVPFSVPSLRPKTVYYWYVRANCGDDGVSLWSKGSAFETTFGIAPLPYSCDFEDVSENQQWILKNGEQVNKWFIGSAVNYGGSNGLYISNHNNGEMNTFNPAETSYVYAIRTLYLDVADYYVFHFNWKGIGESLPTSEAANATNDLLRAFLVPVNIELEAGDAHGMSGSANTVPSGWIEVDDGKLNMQSEWQTKTVERYIANAGVYNLVFFWKNDAANGYQPPAAVDNIRVERVLCHGVDNPRAAGITATTATILWDDREVGASTWNIKVSTTPLIDPGTTAGNIFNGQITSNPYLLTNLLPGTLQYVYIQVDCGDEKSIWYLVPTFTTLCGDMPVPYAENFHRTGIPPCWEHYRGMADQVFGGLALTSLSTAGWQRYTTGYGIADPHMKMNPVTTQLWFVSPVIHLSRAAELSFDLALTANNNGNSIADITAQGDDQFMVIISENAGVTWKAANATIWNNKPNGDYVYNQIPNVAQRVSIRLNNYTGKKIKVAFYGESTDRYNGNNDLHIGNILVDTLRICEPPLHITPDSIGLTGAQFSWEAGDTETAWQLVYGLAGFDPDTVSSDRIVNINTPQPYLLQGLTMDTNYDLYLRSVCGGNSTGEWSSVVSFKTLDACPAPTGLTVTDLHDVKATISWKNGYTETAWQLVYGLADFDPDTVSSDRVVNINSPLYLLQGLTMDTDYDLYLRSVCGATAGIWSSALNFRTMLTPAQMPYDYGFEDTDENNKWVLVNGSQPNQWLIGAAVNNGGIQSLYISKDGYANAYDPAVLSTVYAYRTVLLSTGVLSYSFDWKCQGENNNDYMYAFLAPASGMNLIAGLTHGITTQVTPTGWIPLSTTPLLQKTSWEECKGNINITSAGYYNLVFYWRNNDNRLPANSLPPVIDNILLILDADNACHAPKNLNIKLLTDNSGKLEWFSDDPDAVFNVKVSSAPINPETGAGDKISIQTQDRYLDITDLLPSTPYYAYVQTACDDIDPSYWTSVSFTTGCAPVVAPIVEHFDIYGAGVGHYPTCWRYLINKTDAAPKSSLIPPYIVDDVYSKPDTKSLRLSSYFNGQTKDVTKVFAIMPRLGCDVRELSLRFDGYTSSRQLIPLQVGVMTDLADATTFEPIASVTLSEVWSSHLISFDSYADDGRYVAFLADGDAAQTSFTAYIDRVQLDSIRPCQAPVSVNVTTVTHDEATVAWTPLSSGDTKFQIRISTLNSGSNTANVDTISSFAVDTVVTVTNGIFNCTVNGLKGSTDYYVYLRVVCQDGSYGEWYMHSVTFHTTCDPTVSLPYVDNLNSYGFGLGKKPECWTITGTAGDLPHCSVTYRYGAGASLYFTTSSTTNAFAVLPAISDPLTTAQVTFMGYKTTSASAITIGIMTDPSNVSTFDSITTVSPAESHVWQEFVIPLSGYSGQGRHVAFRSQEIADNSFYIDNVIVERIPNCIKPASISANNITDVSADITFVPAGTATQWNLKVGAYGFNPTTGGTLIPGLTGNVYPLADLLPSSRYDVYVQSDCGGVDGVSTWRGPVTVYTTQVVDTLPLISDFETDAGAWRISSNGGRNVFAVGNATSKDGANALYVSINGGVSYTYDTWNTSFSYAYRKVPLQEGLGYDVSFNWLCDGITTWDLLRLFLIPDAVDISSGNPYGMTGATNTVPTGWIDLSGVLSGADRWQTRRHSIVAPATGTYKLAFFWKNTMGDGRTPPLPAAVDNLYFDTQNCYRPKISSSDLTVTTAKLFWESDALSWQVIADTVEHSEASLNSLPENTVYHNFALDTFTVNLTELKQDTRYYFYVRGLCEGAETTNWGTLAFATPAALPLLTDFEDDGDNAKWYLSTNSGYNRWTIGTAGVESGKGLYISNDGGNTNAYSPLSLSFAYAYRDVYLPAKQWYVINFDWKAQGEQDYDLLRAFLIPESVNLSTGDAYGMTAANNTAPADWIDVGNGIMQAQDTWQNAVDTVLAPAAGRYKLTFFWKNNASSGIQPPAAIDNILIAAQTCYEPIIYIDSITSRTARLSWRSDATSWQVIVDTVAHTAVSLDTLAGTTVVDNFISIEELTPGIVYYFYVRGFCGTVDTTTWNSQTFATLTELPYRTDFEDPTDNAKWRFGDNGGDNRWAVGTAAAKDGNGMYISSDNGITNAYITSSNAYAYVYRTFHLENTSVYSISFDWRSEGDAYDLLRVLLVPDGEDISSGNPYGMVGNINTLPTGWIDLGNGPLNENSSWQTYVNRFQTPTSGIYQLTFFWKNDESEGVQPPAAVDNLTIQEVTCIEPINLQASISGNSATLDWEPGNAHVSGWRVLVSSTSIDPLTETADVIDTVVTVHPFTIDWLFPAKNYYCYVQNICTDTTLWSEETAFWLPCAKFPIPFTEDFGNASYPPVCWERYSGWAADVFKGSTKPTTINGGWYRTTSGNGIANPHVEVYLFIDVQNYWLVSPVIHVDSTVALIFDFALTAHGSSSPIADISTHQDDQFMVIISDDAGATWQAANATIWNNQPNGNFVLNQASNVAKRVEIDLLTYKGRDIRIAFYTESSVSDNDIRNDLHFGNIEIVPIMLTQVADTTCQGYDYTGFEVFDIPATELSQAGLFTFTAPKKLPSGSYQRLTLNLTVSETRIDSINAAICDSKPYSGNGFYQSQIGVYRRNLIASTGCDSMVILTLAEAQNVETSSSVTIAAGDLPYHYHDTVIPVNATGEHVLIFHGTTVAGCDSTHTLTVSIGVDVPFSDRQTFNLMPNPVACGNEVRIEADFSAADRNGLTVEVFNSVGARLMRSEPETYPIRLTAFERSGVYLVRITTGMRKVFYGKLIVQ